MLTKANFPNLNAAYFCSTNAHLASPHPTPVHIYSIGLLLCRTTARNVERAYQGKNIELMQAMQTLPGLINSPWCNGNIPLLSFHPVLSEILNLAQQIFSTPQAFNILPIQVLMQSGITQLQNRAQTKLFAEKLDAWTESFKAADKVVTAALNQITKNVVGFEIEEFSILYNTNQHGSLQIEFLKNLVTNEMKKLFNENESEKCLAIFVKSEPRLNQCMNIRFIVLLQKDYIDDPIGFSEFCFFEKLKHIVASNSNYAFIHETNSLNGFLSTKRFNKKDPNYRELVRSLKSYFIGTDALYRIGNLAPTLEIAYFKYGQI